MLVSQLDDACQEAVGGLWWRRRLPTRPLSRPPRLRRGFSATVRPQADSDRSAIGPSATSTTSGSVMSPGWRVSSYPPSGPTVACTRSAFTSGAIKSVASPTYRGSSRCCPAGAWTSQLGTTLLYSTEDGSMPPALSPVAFGMPLPAQSRPFVAPVSGMTGRSVDSSGVHASI